MDRDTAVEKIIALSLRDPQNVGDFFELFLVEPALVDKWRLPVLIAIPIVSSDAIDPARLAPTNRTATLTARRHSSGCSIQGKRI